MKAEKRGAWILLAAALTATVLVAVLGVCVLFGKLAFRESKLKMLTPELKSEISRDFGINIPSDAVFIGGRRSGGLVQDPYIVVLFKTESGESVFSSPEDFIEGSGEREESGYRFERCYRYCGEDDSLAFTSVWYLAEAGQTVYCLELIN